MKFCRHLRNSFLSVATVRSLGFPMLEEITAVDSVFMFRDSDEGDLM